MKEGIFMNLKKISPENAEFNVFKKIGSDWMLISACDESRTDKKLNTMTASWGGFGVLWGKNVFFCFIRPQRFTKEFIDASDTISLSFFNESHRQALTKCGKLSGRDCDKISEAGLTPYIENNAVFFKEASVTIVGKKLFAQYIDKNSFIDKSIIDSCYSAGDFHEMYVCEITGIYKSDNDM